MECFILSKIINRIVYWHVSVELYSSSYGRSSDDLCEQGTVNSGTTKRGKFLDIL